MFRTSLKKYFLVFCDCSEALLFLSVIRKKKITKRKTAGCRFRAKIFTFFFGQSPQQLVLKKKNSLRSNSFFFLTEKCKNFFTLFHGGRSSPPWRAHRFARWGGCYVEYYFTCHPDHSKEGNITLQRAKRCCEKIVRSGLTFWA